MKNRISTINIVLVLALFISLACTKKDDEPQVIDPIEIDYSNLMLGIKGEGVIYNGNASSWDSYLSSRLPVEVEDNLFEYNFGLVFLNQGCNFQITDNDSSSEFYGIGLSDATLTGDAADSLHAAENNGFTTHSAESYFLKFYIDADNDQFYLKVDLMVPIILDGIYILGEGTALNDFDNNSKMIIAKNEVTQEDRATLLERYIAVKSGSEGFNIYHC